MADVLVYSTRICPYCVRAKQHLTRKGVSYREIMVDDDPQQREQMMRITGRRTVPQILIDGQPIGGCDDLLALDRAGKLDPLLGLA
ncbi:MAG: glutaredoxin 3 [Gammaproteobacteria bacterium]|nr:glutaredoxin 3 [Gammaproteobacteria bacterium]